MIVWFLVGNGGMDPCSSPYIIPNNSPHNPFPHSLLRTRQLKSFDIGLGGVATQPEKVAVT